MKSLESNETITSNQSRIVVIYMLEIICSLHYNFQLSVGVWKMHNFKKFDCLVFCSIIATGPSDLLVVQCGCLTGLGQSDVDFDDHWNRCKKKKKKKWENIGNSMYNNQIALPWTCGEFGRMEWHVRCAGCFLGYTRCDFGCVLHWKEHQHIITDYIRNKQLK